MAASFDFSSKDFDPLAYVRGTLSTMSKDIQKNADEQVKQTNQLLFKMHIMENEASNTLQTCTKQVLQDIRERLDSRVEQPKILEIPDTSSPQTHLIRNEFTQLYEVNRRIKSCQVMSQEIEHFETRIAKVEEFIRHNRFLELVSLVQQI